MNFHAMNLAHNSPIITGQLSISNISQRILRWQNTVNMAQVTKVARLEKIGSGEVIYITDNPYFRAFWKSGRVLLGNTVLR